MESSWTFGQFIVGILVAGVGFVVVWKSDWMLKSFGRIPVAEKYLTSEGGSRLFFKLIGILILTFGIMHAVNLLNPFGTWFVNEFFGSFVSGPKG